MTLKKNVVTKLLITCAGMFFVALSACGGTPETTRGHEPGTSTDGAVQVADDLTGGAAQAADDSTEGAVQAADGLTGGAAAGARETSSGISSDAERAVRRFLEETAKNPQIVDGWVQLSDAYLWLAADSGDLAQIAQAESAVTTALALDPVDVHALNQASAVRSAQHRYEDILHIQRESIFYGHLNAESWGIAGDAYMDLGRYRSADSCYYTMFELEPDFGSLVRVARRMFDIGDFEEAVGYAAAAVDTAWTEGEQSKRSLADACVMLGRMHLSRGDWGQAMTWLDSSLQVVAGYVPALEQKAEIHRLRGDLAQSKKIYRQLAGASRDPRYLSGLARVYVDEGDGGTVDSLVNVAAGIYKESYQNYPDVVRRDYVAFLLGWDRDLELAQQLAYKESRQRRDVDTYDLLAWAYYKNENYNLAWSSIALALRREAKHPRIIYHAAVIAKAAGKPDRYETYSARVRKMNPKFESMYGTY